MEAIILAGGLGTRLRHVVPNLPKPMAPIGKRPFLEILLTMLAHKGFKRIVFSLGFMAEKIILHFGEHFSGMELLYEVEEQPLGTGGAARAALEQCSANHVYIFNGDTYLELETDEIEKMWDSKQSPVIVVREVPNTYRYGRVQVRNHRVVEFLEKGVAGTGHINAGCYVLSRNALNDFALDQPFSLEKDFIMKYLDDIVFRCFTTQSQFIDIGVPEDYALAQKLIGEI